MSNEEPFQLDLFSLDEDCAPPVLNGMYYEKSTNKFVSFVLGKRHYEESARGCRYPKEWQEKIKKERVI